MKKHGLNMRGGFNAIALQWIFQSGQVLSLVV